MSELNLDSSTREALFEYVLRLGDDALVAGHRLSEWCGHGPMLEEDIALANIALDLIGQANALLGLAGTLEGEGRDQDDLAYHRDARQYRNALMLELPKGDFGFTITRQFLFSAYAVLLFEQLKESLHPTLAGIAAKAHKELRYHVRHSGGWLVRLGDGTEESHARVQASLNQLWRFTGELFETDDVLHLLIEQKLAPDASALQPRWEERVRDVLQQATLTVPEDVVMQTGGRQGRHTEHLGHMLAVMQVLPRTYPEAEW